MIKVVEGVKLKNEELRDESKVYEEIEELDEALTTLKQNKPFLTRPVAKAKLFSP